MTCQRLISNNRIESYVNYLFLSSGNSVESPDL